jgi:hypothetical protein
MRVWPADPRRFVGALKRDVRRAFPDLGTVEVAYLWRGTLGRPVHRMPQIGEIAPGQWVASGFAGHGLNTTAMAGELIARGIVEKDDTWRLFAPYEVVWAGGGLGRAAAQGLYWMRSADDKAAQALARRRARRRQRKSARKAGQEQPAE